MTKLDSTLVYMVEDIRLSMVESIINVLGYLCYG